MKRIGILFICAMVIACTNVQKVPEPDNLIAKAKMEKILYDITIIAAARGYSIQQFARTGVDPVCHVFEKYNIDSTQYAQSTLYYSASLEEYKQIVENVSTRIEQEHKVVDSAFQEEKRVKDSIRSTRAKNLRKKSDSVNQSKVPSGIPERTVIEVPVH